MIFKIFLLLRIYYFNAKLLKLFGRDRNILSWCSETVLFLFLFFNEVSHLRGINFQIQVFNIWKPHRNIWQACCRLHWKNISWDIFQRYSNRFKSHHFSNTPRDRTVQGPRYFRGRISGSPFMNVIDWLGHI